MYLLDSWFLQMNLEHSIGSLDMSPNLLRLNLQHMYTLQGMESTKKLHINLIDQTKYQLGSSQVLLNQRGSINL